MTSEIGDEKSIVTEMSPKQAVQTGLLGFVAGVVAGGATLLFSAFVFKTLPCVASACETGGQYAAVLAGIISGAVGLFWLMRIHIFRPLLIVLAVTIALWGVPLYTLALPWYVVLLIAGGLHAVAYELFTWIARLRQFWLVLLLMVLIVIALRFILAG